ncbi:MAG: magnesium chelatase subunit H [Sphingomonadaceae bacterium]
MTQNRTSRVKSSPLRVVIVTLDNHLSGTVERAQAAFDADGSGISIGFHAAADFGSDATMLAACQADIARGDIIIVTMMFLEDHIRAVLPALEARREDCAAMVCLMSGGDVVKLTKMGGYRMDAPAKGLMGMLKRLRGAPKAKSADSGAGQMKMLRRLPKILRFIPGAAQDVRAYFLTMQYWLAGSDDNVINMIRALANRYTDAKAKGAIVALAPAEYPEVGVYHPAIAGKIAHDISALPRTPKATATVGLLVLRSYVLGKDTAHYDGVINALEARGVRVIPAFANGLDSRPAIEKLFMVDGVPSVDAIVSLTGFSLVGGPAYNDSSAAEAILAKLDRPYIAAHPLEFQTLQKWGQSRQGLLPLEATMMVAIPELDGAIAPTVFGGRSDGSANACTGCSRGCTFAQGGLVREMQSCPERAEALAAKVVKLVALRQAERAERKVALVLFNFPPNSGAAGTAAFLSVFESAFNTLSAMKATGYTVDMPTSVDAFRDALLIGNAAYYGADVNVHARIMADDHVRREPHLAEIEAQWGPAPGRAQSDGQSIHIYGERFGNIFVGMQPAFGYEGDPMRLLFEGRFSPTHAFSAFYRWLREDFGAHAALHFGTHGALEFMPGKQVGLSGDCWPERLIADLPNFYLYAANNPSEGMTAKRRSNATLISYLTPPTTQAGLYKGLIDVKAMIDRWRMSPPEAIAERETLSAMIHAAGVEIDLLEAGPEWDASSDAEVQALGAKIYELEQTLIPHGLHVVGKGASPEERAELLAAMATAQDKPLADCDFTEIDALLAKDHELDAIIAALDGRYIHPVAGGDVLRDPSILPTGRNIHGFDPFRIPSAYAVVDGAAQAEKVVARHMADTGEFPESIAMVLWGTDNLKSEGAQIAQALALMGAKPRFDSYGRLSGADLIPLAELGRPRIDVITTLSGIFRDLLPLQSRMLAQAALLASTADEPLDQNFVRKHSLAHQNEHGCDIETASLRVFSNNAGAYGANVNQMIDGSTWDDGDDLADSFERQKGFAYGVDGAPQSQIKIMKSALAGVDFAFQNLESVDIGLTTIDQYVDGLGGISRSIARAKGKQAPVYISDQTQGAGKVRTLNEQLALETRTRMLNPLWYEGMLQHGGEGVHMIEGAVTTTMGWSATTGQVDPWVYQQITETFVLDDDMRARMARLNPKSSAKVASRLIEASERNFWQPDAATLAALHAASDDIEDQLEGILQAAE